MCVHACIHTYLHVYTRIILLKQAISKGLQFRTAPDPVVLGLCSGISHCLEERSRSRLHGVQCREYGMNICSWDDAEPPLPWPSMHVPAPCESKQNYTIIGCAVCIDAIQKTTPFPVHNTRLYRLLQRRQGGAGRSQSENCGQGTCGHAALGEAGSWA